MLHLLHELKLIYIGLTEFYSAAPVNPFLCPQCLYLGPGHVNTPSRVAGNCPLADSWVVLQPAKRVGAVGPEKFFLLFIENLMKFLIGL